MGKINLFPLSIVAYPTKIIPLHIFEERYKRMIADCVSNNKEFGIVFRTPDGLAQYGCSINIIELVNQYSDGRMDIKTIGSKIFKLNSHQMKDEIIIGNIDYVEFSNNMEDKKFIALKEKYIKLLMQLGQTSELDRHLKKIHSFQLLEYINFPSEFELILISQKSESKRIKLLSVMFDKLTTMNLPSLGDEHFTS